MSDDLVTRLRRAVIWNGVVPHGDFLAMEAAAEIERLRALLEGYEAMEKYMKHEAMK